MRECFYERELFSHPVGVRLDLVVLVLREPEIIEELREHALRLPLIYTVGAGEEVSVRPAGKVPVVGRMIHHQAHPSPRLLPLLNSVRVADTEGAALRCDGGRENAQEGALTGAVRAHEAEDLTRFDLEADVRNAASATLVETRNVSRFERGGLLQSVLSGDSQPNSRLAAGRSLLRASPGAVELGEQASP